ncbi:SpoIID/LytB domain-containing protein [Egbenema bharatensis]|uniref:SpoIID/LytB domain-containing protein n=1 Tax=Egbenema bharatensis TaxID=3463334 RepID=UPI003A87DE85
MARWQLPKQLKPYRWVLLSLLGILSLTIAIVLGQMAWHQGEPGAAFSESAPIESPLPAVTPEVPLESPASSPLPAKESAVGKLEADTTSEPSSLTPEQQAIQEAAIVELESAIPTVDSLVEMKVAIAVSVPSVTVGTSAEAYVLDKTGQQVDSLTAGNTYTAQISGDAVVFNGSPLTQVIWVEPSPDGVFYLNNRAYRGRLLLAAANGSLWAVNYVSMRNYLYSVIPSEVSPSWNMAALKAQSVAARSYALHYYFQPINDLYDMGNDEYFQVYSGIRTEADRTKQAVNETAGEYVSYKGGVVESLYAASDDIVAEVFQGQGMSQLGALRLANQGYTYEQILANYYPGTKVARIVQDF